MAFASTEALAKEKKPTQLAQIVDAAHQRFPIRFEARLIAGAECFVVANPKRSILIPLGITPAAELQDGILTILVPAGKIGGVPWSWYWKGQVTILSFEEQKEAKIEVARLRLEPISEYLLKNRDLTYESSDEEYITEGRDRTIRFNWSQEKDAPRVTGLPESFVAHSLADGIKANLVGLELVYIRTPSGDVKVIPARPVPEIVGYKPKSFQCSLVLKASEPKISPRSGRKK